MSMAKEGFNPVGVQMTLKKVRVNIQLSNKISDI